MDIPTKDLKNYLDKANEYRRKVGKPPHISVTLTKREIEVLEARLKNANNWFKVHDSNHPDFKKNLEAAESLEDKKIKLESAIKEELAMREREWFQGVSQKTTPPPIHETDISQMSTEQVSDLLL